MTDAKFYRNLICAGLGALAFSYVPLSQAGYAQVSPPPGYSPGNGLASGAGGTYSYPSASNAAGYSGGTVRTNVALNVGGRAVSVPASMRIASNAGRVAAAAIYLNPALRTAAAVATWLGAAGLAYDVASGLWKKPDNSYSTSDGYYYWAQAVPYVSVQERFQTADALCQKALAGFKANNTSDWSWTLVQCDAGLRKMEIDGFYKGGAANPYRYDFNRSVDSSCPAGWYVTPAGCVQTPPMTPVTQPQFEQMLPDARPMPPELPGIVWPAAWPIELPEIQPTFIPTGNPVPNPKYDPNAVPSPANQPYVQPGINVQPAPTPSSPWQVDIQPVNRPAANPNPSPDPTPNTNPDGTPKPDPGDQQRDPKDEDKQDLCEKHPDILACQKIDTEVPDDKIPKSQKTISFQPEDSFGGGSCPADQYASVGGQQLKVVDWARDCHFISSYIRPLAMVIGLLLAVGIVSKGLD